MITVTLLDKYVLIYEPLILMLDMKLKCILLVLVGTFTTNLVAQNIDSDIINAYLDNVAQVNIEAGSLSVFKGGKEVYSYRFGYDNLPEGVSDNNTQYQIGSVTKMFTSVLVFKLVEQGKLKLTDKLAKYYPDLPNAKDITIKNMLEHTSGLGSYVVKNGEVWVTEKQTDEAILDLIKEQGVKFAPGKDVAYSNSAYYLLSKIVESVSHKPYHELVDTYICKPLELKNTYSANTYTTNVFRPFHFKDNKWTDIKEIDTDNIIGVGDIASTMYDLNVFIYGVFHDKLLSKQSFSQMLPIKNKEKWGRGINTFDEGGHIYYGHGGDTLGTHTILMYNPDEDVAIAYSSNAQRVPQEVFKNILYIIYGKEYSIPLVVK